MKEVLKWVWAWLLVGLMAAAIHNGDLAIAALLAGGVFLMCCDWIVEAIQENHKIQANIHRELRIRTDEFLDDYLNAYLKANQDSGR